MHCGRLVVQAQRLMQAFVGSTITGETIRRISEGFVIKGDSTEPEITRCLGSAPRSWAAVTMKGRSRNGGRASAGKGAQTEPFWSRDNESTWKHSLVGGWGGVQ